LKICDKRTCGVRFLLEKLLKKWYNTGGLQSGEILPLMQEVAPVNLTGVSL